MNIWKLLFVGAAAAALASCSTTRDILYFQNIDEAELEKLTTAYEAVIKKDDLLTIVVTGPDKNVTGSYNLTLYDISTDMGVRGSDPERSTLGFLVDSNGDIDFPVLGKIHVEGMTRNQLSEYICAEVSKDVKNPIVYVRFRNYKVTVLGEVTKPGTYSMETEKVTVLQAIAAAGDLKLTAKRDDILLLREEDGKVAYHSIDLKDSRLLDSPYYFMQQNDVLYIPPSAGRVASATNTVGVWTSFIASISSTIALIITVLSIGL